MQASMKASGGFGTKIQSMKKMVRSGASQMPVSGTGGWHPVQKLRFNASNIQDNLRRAEGGILVSCVFFFFFHLRSACLPWEGYHLKKVKALGGEQ